MLLKSTSSHFCLLVGGLHRTSGETHFHLLLFPLKAWSARENITCTGGPTVDDLYFKEAQMRSRLKISADRHCDALKGLFY